MANSNSEKFTFKLGKFTFDSRQPGKETRKTVALVGGIIVLVLLVTALVFYFLKINILSTAFLAGCTIFANSCRKKIRGD